eukprot:357516-Chlamydomonas_euryale.AAC.10
MSAGQRVGHRAPPHCYSAVAPGPQPASVRKQCSPAFTRLLLHACKCACAAGWYEGPSTVGADGEQERSPQHGRGRGRVGNGGGRGRGSGGGGRRNGG